MKKIILSLFVLNVSILFSEEIILVQGAMDIEVNTFINALENKQEERIGSYYFWKGSIGKKAVVVSRTEIGLVNAAASTAIAIEKYKPVLIINQGTAGGHDPKLHTGDIVIGKEVVNIGSFRTERKEYGVPENPRDWEFFPSVQRLRDKNGKEEINLRFYSDKKYMDMIKKIKYKNGNVVVGVIGSADQWNRELERIKYINEVFKTSAEEMEAVAVAQVAKGFNIPYLSVRILSNTEIYNEMFKPETAVWCQEYVIDFIKSLK